MTDILQFAVGFISGIAMGMILLAMIIDKADPQNERSDKRGRNDWWTLR